MLVIFSGWNSIDVFISTSLCIYFRRHTLAYVPDSGRVYSFGAGSCGQLGLGTTDKKTSPFLVPCPFLSSNSNRSSTVMEHDGATHVVQRIYSGGNKCIVLANKVTAQVNEISCKLEIHEIMV